MTLPEINQLLLSTLRDIDAEAMPVEGDYPTGLWWYTGHLDRDRKSRKVLNSEVEWTRRMAELLPGNKHSLRASEQKFPGSRQRCDVVIDIGKPKPFWIEVKGAWRAYFDPPKPNKAYEKHLHAAAADVEKLQTLTPSDACGIAFVLVGFDQPKLPITAEHLDIVCAKVTDPDWTSSSVEWDIKGRVNFRTRLWIWSRWTI